MRFEIVWYRGAGEHGYEEFRRTPAASLVEAIAYLVRRFGEDVVFDALTGIQSEIAWVTDILGFTIEKDGQSWNRTA